MQEFHVKIDMMFITQLIYFLGAFAATSTEEKQLKEFRDDLERPQRTLNDIALAYARMDERFFFNDLRLGRLLFHLSFTMAGMQLSALPVLMGTLLQGAGVTLTVINDIVFEFGRFERDSRFFTAAELAGEIQMHYIGQGLRQVHVLLLGLDVIGNPYGLVVGLKQGVVDFVNEPVQGARLGPLEFGMGVGLGARSLLMHTVGGVCGVVSK